MSQSYPELIDDLNAAIGTLRAGAPGTMKAFSALAREALAPGQLDVKTPPTSAGYTIIGNRKIAIPVLEPMVRRYLKIEDDTPVDIESFSMKYDPFVRVMSVAIFTKTGPCIFLTNPSDQTSDQLTQFFWERMEAHFTSDMPMELLAKPVDFMIDWLSCKTLIFMLQDDAPLEAANEEAPAADTPVH